MRARISGAPPSSAWGPRSQRNPSRRALATRPPGAAPSSMSATSWPRTDSRWALVRPEMPPPTIAIRTVDLDPAPSARRRLDQIGQRADEGGVAAHGAGAGEVQHAGPLGAFFVEDVDLLQRLDV